MSKYDLELPTLFHIGVQKAGSTLLYNLLDSHPDTSMSCKTEIHFYYKYFNKGFSWYLNLFQGADVKIDTSPKYFINGRVAAPLIKEVIGSDRPRFLLMLKNPIDVVNSHFLMNLTRGHFAQNPKLYPVIPENLLDCIKLYPTYLDQVKYYELLQESWFKHFKKKQFHIEILERFSSDQEQSLKNIQNFLGLRITSLSAGTFSQNRLLKSAFWYTLQGVIVKKPALKKHIKQSVIAQWVLKNFATTSSSKKITSAEREELAKLLKFDVEKLKVLLHDPIPEWQDFT